MVGYSKFANNLMEMQCEFKGKNIKGIAGMHALRLLTIIL